MKQISAVLLGYGDRSSRYSEYAVLHPEELKISGVIDPDPLKRRAAGEKFGLSEDMRFCSLEEFLAKNIRCDAVINATMDELHYPTTVRLLENRYDVLLEKPVVPDAGQLREIEWLAEQNDCRVVVCHVLRYTPFYSEIKKIIDSGELGKVMNIQLNEHVWHGHFVNAYVRGKWRSQKQCGSGLLLAKCCHDLDLMCWMLNATEPKWVSSFGSRSFYCPENAPEGSAEYCYNCPRREGCMFDAYTFELEKDFIPFYTWAGLHKDIADITREEKEEFLKRDVYGKCVFKTDMDIVDRQCVSVEFANGAVGTLNVVGGASKAGRHIHVVLEYGEIVGYIEEDKFILRRFDRDKVDYTDEVIDFNAKVSGEDNSVGGHYGGDYYIMKDLVRYLSGEPTSGATTVLADSVNSHLCCYAAEKSRAERRSVEIAREYPKK